MKLKELRIQEKKSQEEFAKQFKLTQKTYSNYENGITQPEISKLIEIADYFNVSLDYLVDRKENNELRESRKSEQELLKYYRQLSIANQLKLIGEAMGMIAMQNN